MSAWVNPTNYNGDCVIIGGLYLCVTNSGKLTTYCYGRTLVSSGVESYVTGSIEIPKGQWTHIAAVWDDYGVTGYVNGVQDFRVALNAGTSYSNHYKKDIGSENRTNNRSFIGYIDDVRIYHTALTKEAIEEMVNARTRISKNRTVLTNQFIEKPITMDIKKNYSIESDSFNEEIDEIYERLEYLEAPYIDSDGTKCPHIDTGIVAGTKIRRLETHHQLVSAKNSQIMFGNDGFYAFYREWNDPRPYYGFLGAGATEYLQTSILMTPSDVYASIDIYPDKTSKLYVHQTLSNGIITE